MAENLGSAVLELRTDSAALDRGLAGGTAGLKSFTSAANLARLAVVGIGIAAVGAFASMIKQAADAQRVMAQTNAVIASTGGAAGFSARQFADMATELSRLIPIDDEVIQATENMLATFVQVRGDEFKAATEAALDMAIALGGEPVDAAMRLGKALNDPIAGVTALRRVGVQLTDAQQEQIKSFMAVNDIASAQKIILAELTTEFGGSAKAAGETFAGQLAIARTQLGNVAETLGGVLIPILTTAAAALSALIYEHQDDIQRWADAGAAAMRRLGEVMRPLFALFDRKDLLIVMGVLFAGMVAGFLAIAGAATAAFIAENAALLGIPIAVAAAVAAIVLLVRHWNEVRTAIEHFVDTHKVLVGVILGLSGPIGWFIGAAILVIKNWTAVRNTLADVWSAIVQFTNAGVGAAIAAINSLIGAIQGALNAIIKAINAIPDIKIPGWVPGLGGKGFGIPDITELELTLIPHVDLSNIDFPHIGFDIGSMIGGGVDAGIDGALPPSVFDDTLGAAGASGGAAAAESLVPAFVQAMAAREATLAEIAQIIEGAISARNVRWADVARLYELGAVEIARDFTDALTGEISNIGAQIWVAASIENEAAARKAGIEAARAYIDAFTQGLGDLQSAIDAAFGSISQLTSTMTVEDAQLELDILLAQRDALYDINKLEETRAGLVERIAEIEARVADSIAAIEATAEAHIAAIQTRIYDQEKSLGVLQQQLEEEEQIIRDIQAAADVAIAVIREGIAANEQVIDSLRGQIKDFQRAIRDVRAEAEAQAAVVEADIGLHEKTLSLFQKELKVKQETLRNDQATLAVYRRSAEEHQRLLGSLESQLKSLQDERASAWAILGLAPGGGAIPPTLKSAATDLKKLQDEMKALTTGRAGSTWNIGDLLQGSDKAVAEEIARIWGTQAGVQTDARARLQEQIDAAQAVFDALDAELKNEIDNINSKIAAQSQLLAQDAELIAAAEAQLLIDQADIEITQKLIDETEAKIEADREAIASIQASAAAQIASIQAQIDATNDLIDATQEQIDADKERIEAIQAAADAEKAVVQERIDGIKAQIDAVKDAIAADKELIAEIQEVTRVQIAAIREAADAEIAALEDQIAAVDASIAKIKEHIATLQAEQTAREAARRITELQLLLENDLLLTDEELNQKIADQIELAIDLSEVYDHLRDHTLTARDAFIALGAELEDLAALINQLIANPALYETVPLSASAGGVSGMNIPLAPVTSSAVASGSRWPTWTPEGYTKPSPTMSLTVNVEERSPAAIAHAVEMAGLRLGRSLALEGV